MSDKHDAERRAWDSRHNPELDETAKAADPVVADPVVALPFVSSSEVIDKIHHAQELIEDGSGEALDHAISKLNEVIELLPGWLFAPPNPT